MPRGPRLLLPGVPVHITHRGNNKQPCFLRVSDYRQYLTLLERAAAEQECRVHAYVLMTNHVHLLMTGASARGVSRTMKRVAEIYAMSFNRRNSRSGSLWQGRFGSSLVQDGAYLFNCYRYIEMNPVRAGMVGSPAAYRWSSYRANAFGAKSFVLPHSLYLDLASSPDARLAAYKSLFDVPEDEDVLRRIRDAARSDCAYGDDAFCIELERCTGRRAYKRRRGRKPAS
jgi:putative transposase